METEYGDEAELIASIRGEPFKASWQMEAGTAWARAMEGWNPEKTMDPDLFRFLGFWFRGESIVAAHDHIGPGLAEVKVTRSYATPEGTATVVAKCDHIHGLVVQENKAKFSPIDVRHYDVSLQWKFYLACFGAVCCRYNLFDFAEPDGGNYCHLRNIQTVTYWPYDGLQEECQEWVWSFVAWCKARGLLGYLERSGSSPACAA